mmetsp:Transcript_55505/g.166422  ORF Transcript_55505/g.166422 Transcript_55505/m.166422 type:complete len:178 (-) Transcript_55505:677-1210(-)|eukprot:CAMPEP_0113558946 /NCGR_PEP_ID=MMETSP0015_2-20120614/18628_1 /TAXON_ID=2838 /ORGANISM="Odontella" /LENGTH=177 /DNA_ID=CAMNT_0000460537 /DNA_START=41 /DNA_END=574 /DNA_ORIENTATION=+ /assembly_acc=CAM_ASM_000160
MASFGFGGGAGPSEEDVIVEPSTPWVAAGDGDLPLLQTALRKLDLPVNAADSNGFTFVHAAASYSQLEVLRWLLEQRGGDSGIAIDVNAGDSDGDTPLHHCDDVAAARILIEEGGADASLKNHEGKTARGSKEEELAEGDDEDDEDSDDEDREKLKELIKYLNSLEARAGNEDAEMQ